MSDFLATLRDRVLIFDGAFGTWVQGQDLAADDFGGPELEGCNEHVVLTRPDVIAEMHRSFFDVGVDAVETATFGAFPVVLAEYGIPEKTYELNEAAARIAMAAAGREVPLMVQVTVELTGRMLVGTEIGAALTTLEALRPDVIGLNCATGPGEMTEHLRHLSQHARTFLSALPNAGLPSVVEGRTHYDLTPDELAEAHDRLTNELGVNIVGGCCGTTPEHLRRVVETIGTRAPLERHPV